MMEWMPEGGWFPEGKAMSCKPPQGCHICFIIPNKPHNGKISKVSLTISNLAVNFISLSSIGAFSYSIPLFGIV